MGEQTEPDQFSRESDEFKRFLSEFDTQGLSAGGAVPEGHKGVYVPTSEELREAFRAGHEANLEMVQARAEKAEDLVSSVLQQRDQQAQ